MAAADHDIRTAVLAEGLYLANLLVLPGLAFVALVVLWRRERHGGSALVRNHLAQTLAGSLWAGVLLVGLSASILAVGGFDSGYAWMAVILYFTFFHSTLVLCGMVGLSHALAGKTFVYPLIGPRTS